VSGFYLFILFCFRVPLAVRGVVLYRKRIESDGAQTRNPPPA
jgi:hypothetical protein